VERDVDGFRV
jgi:hypothetical protein